MRIERKWLVVAMLLVVGFGQPRVWGEEPPKDERESKQEHDVIIQEQPLAAGVAQEGRGPLTFGAAAASGTPGGVTFSFVSSEMSFEGKRVKGAPYSAEATTETVQMLSDGNRITQKSTTSMYRDSEGRTRRDLTLGAIGPWAAAGQPPQTTIIQDPVAGVHYILDPSSHTARKRAIPSLDKKPPELSRNATVAKDNKKAAFAEPPPLPVIPGPTEFHYFKMTSPEEKPQTESLGKQVIEGLQAEGTRTTITIPAGHIGNELPIQIVSERWYSPELQTVLLSKHSDPRFGETVYQLTHIDRNEPAHSLFEVPSDYEVKSDQHFFFRDFHKRPAPAEGTP
ncbi:MAG: hypothetical protein DMG06_17230 [Acidobacteria bacterium]|nr:MAG: hypothetical protein DMG06_17230 [Acidobacteriota bacterium]